VELGGWLRGMSGLEDKNFSLMIDIAVNIYIIVKCSWKREAMFLL
jgi:hypothetical protein